MDRFRDEAQAHDIEALGRYRDALLSGAAPAELERLSASLDPALLRLVQQMQSVGIHAWPQPGQTFARKLERDLRQELSHHGATVRPDALHSLNGHVPGPLHWDMQRSQPVELQPWMRPRARYLLVAAVVLLVIFGGVFGQRLLAPDEPAVLTAANGPAVQTLLDYTIEGQSEGWAPLTIEHWTFQPGDASLQVPPLGGPQWIVSDAAPLVATIDGQERDIPADSGLVVQAGQALSVRNPGSEARSLFRGVAVAGFSMEEYDRQSIARQIALDTEAHEALPPGESRVIFDRLILEPGTRLQIEPASGQDWVDIISGQLGLTLTGDNLPDNWQSGHEREVASSELLPALVPGTRVSFRNVGDQSLVLLRLRVSPLPEATATAAS